MHYKKSKYIVVTFLIMFCSILTVQAAQFTSLYTDAKHEVCYSKEMGFRLTCFTKGAEFTVSDYTKLPDKCPNCNQNISEVKIKVKEAYDSYQKECADTTESTVLRILAIPLALVGIIFFCGCLQEFTNAYSSIKGCIYFTVVIIFFLIVVGLYCSNFS